MIKSDIAISSGGSTLYELSVTKTPALVLLQADNQVRVADKLEGKSIMNLGFENDFQVITKKLKRFIKMRNNYLEEIFSKDGFMISL